MEWIRTEKLSMLKEKIHAVWIYEEDTTRRRTKYQVKVKDNFKSTWTVFTTYDEGKALGFYKEIMEQLKYL